MDEEAITKFTEFLQCFETLPEVCRGFVLNTLKSSCQRKSAVLDNPPPQTVPTPTSVVIATSNQSVDVSNAASRPEILPQPPPPPLVVVSQSPRKRNASSHSTTTNDVLANKSAKKMSPFLAKPRSRRSSKKSSSSSPTESTSPPPATPLFTPEQPEVSSTPVRQNDIPTNSSGEKETSPSKPRSRRKYRKIVPDAPINEPEVREASLKQNDIPPANKNGTLKKAKKTNESQPPPPPPPPPEIDVQVESSDLSLTNTDDEASPSFSATSAITVLKSKSSLKCRRRTNFTQAGPVISFEAACYFEQCFRKNPYPPSDRLNMVAKHFGLTVKQLQNWYASRRRALAISKTTSIEEVARLAEQNPPTFRSFHDDEPKIEKAGTIDNSSSDVGGEISNNNVGNLLDQVDETVIREEESAMMTVVVQSELDANKTTITPAPAPDILPSDAPPPLSSSPPHDDEKKSSTKSGSRKYNFDLYHFNSRTVYSLQEKEMLEREFNACNYPTKSDYKRIAADLETSQRRVEMWFIQRQSKQEPDASLSPHHPPQPSPLTGLERCG